jgi:hypothetical protein
MIDITGPDAISFARAAEILPRDRKGRMVRHLTMVRWATRGCGGAVLESARLGRTWYTSRAAIRAFTEAAARKGAKAHQPAEVEAIASRECQLLKAMAI